MTLKDPIPDRIRSELAAAYSGFSFETLPYVVRVGKDLWEKNSGRDFYDLARLINAKAAGKWSVKILFPPDVNWGAALFEFSFEETDDAATFRATLPQIH